MKRSFVLGLTALAVLSVPVLTYSHCQMPCGIYDDAARIKTMHEDATTIEKALMNINELSDKTDAQSANQLVRWINTKEEHASDIIAIVSEYFLTQRVKSVGADDPGYSDYVKKLADHHAVMIAAMKAKQNADTKFGSELHAAIDVMSKYYETEGE